MTDDIVARLRSGFISPICALDAADEITRLRADLAAADAQIKSLDAENESINAELLKARADLAAASSQADMWKDMAESASARAEKAEAELAAARDALKPVAEIADIYEIDAMSVGDLEVFIDVDDLRRARDTLARIDAALGGDGGA